MYLGRFILCAVSFFLLFTPGLHAKEGLRYVILSNEKTFESQVNQSNSIYIIRNVFDLRKSRVTIPRDCILRFEGGEIKNGVIDFNGCTIDANKNHCIFNNLIDFYNLRECSIKWFGAKGDGVTDDTRVFKFVLDRKHISNAITKSFVVKVPFGVYLITDCINPGAFANESYTKVEIIGDEGPMISPHAVLNEIMGSSRAVLYCKGNLKGVPFIYAPSLLKHLSLRGDDNKNRANYKSFLPKYEETIAIRIAQNEDYATYRRIEDLQVHFFGTGIEENDSYGGDWNNVEVYCNGYGVKIIPRRSTITMQTITGLHISKCKYDGLLVEAPLRNYKSLIHFENLICEHADILNNPDSPNEQTYYNIRSNTSISINNGYSENSHNRSDVVNVLLTGGEGALYTLTNFRFLSGTYEFYAPAVIIGSVKSYSARFNMHSFRSNIMNIYIDSLEGYERTNLHNVTVGNKQAVVEKPFASYSSKDRPYWNKMEAGEFYYDTDLNQLVYWNGENWSNLDGVNISGVTISQVIGDSSKRRALVLTKEQVGFRFFDTSLKKPLWWSGIEWVDAMGQRVQ